MKSTPNSLKIRLAVLMGVIGGLCAVLSNFAFVLVSRFAAPPQGNFVSQFILGAVLCYTVSFTAVWLSARHIITPLSNLVAALDRMRVGSSGIDIPVHTEYAEVHDLSLAMRSLIETLQEQEAQLKELNGTLEKRVEERTEALERSNAILHDEIEERQRIERERQSLIEQLQQLAQTDSLTGLHNRRHFLNLAEREWQRARRLNRTFAIIMIDLDHFKDINDTCGHSAGDIVLQSVAQRCRKAVREIDLLARYGGEEFVILLQETDTMAAVMVAERLRTSLAATPIVVDDKALSVTASLGVAITLESTSDIPQLIESADAALYRAKRGGRNRVVVA